MKSLNSVNLQTSQHTTHVVAMVETTRETESQKAKNWQCYILQSAINVNFGSAA